MRRTSIVSVNNFACAMLAIYQFTFCQLAIAAGRISETCPAAVEMARVPDGYGVCLLSRTYSLTQLAPTGSAAVARARTTAARNRLDSAKALDLRASIAAAVLGCCTLFVSVRHVCLHSCDVNYHDHMRCCIAQRGARWTPGTSNYFARHTSSG
jgi:hypothetical protein